MRLFSALLPALILSGCATVPPSDPDNICHMFRENPHWHRYAIRVKEKWGTPVHVPMAIMYQESKFVHDAKPPRRYILGLIPWGRVSSAHGYAQALEGTWADYKAKAGRTFASRERFSDSLDFIGWYMDQSQRQNKVSKWDAYGQYLNYHEGWGGYRKKSYVNKPWLQRVARNVEARAKRYSAQYAGCQRPI